MSLLFQIVLLQLFISQKILFQTLPIGIFFKAGVVGILEKTTNCTQLNIWIQENMIKSNHHLGELSYQQPK